MGKLFGTDGIRGMANSYPIVPEVALQVGKAIAYVFAAQRLDIRADELERDDRHRDRVWHAAVDDDT